MHGHRSRRAFLAAAGAGLAAVAGCTAPATSGGDPPGASPTDSETDENGGSGTDADSDTSGSPSASKAVELPAGAAWPTFGGDAANTGRRDTGPGPSSPVASAWRTNVDGIYTMPGPVVAEGTVYVGSGELAYAADAVTGEMRWSVGMDDLTHYFSPSLTADGVLFAAQSNVTGGDPGTLASFTPGGDERWSREFAVTSSPTALDGTVFVGASPDEAAAVRAFSDADGSDAWTHSLDATLTRGAPAVADGVVFATATDVPSESGVVAALDADDGGERWSRSLDSKLEAAPVVRERTVYVQADDGKLWALDARSGETRWSTRLGRKAKTAPALSDEYLVGMVENQLVGVSLTSGELEWRTDIGYTLINGVCIGEDRAYVGGSLLTAVDVASGEVAWERPVPGAAGGFGAPVVVGNTVFVGVCIKHEAHDPYDDFLFAYV